MRGESIHLWILTKCLIPTRHGLQAEEITVTIGRAFELAYRKFLESGGKDVETRKQIGSLQKRVC